VYQGTPRSPCGCHQWRICGWCPALKDYLLIKAGDAKNVFTKLVVLLTANLFWPSTRVVMDAFSTPLAVSGYSNEYSCREPALVSGKYSAPFCSAQPLNVMQIKTARTWLELHHVLPRLSEPFSLLLHSAQTSFNQFRVARVRHPQFDGVIREPIWALPQPATFAAVASKSHRLRP